MTARGTKEDAELLARLRAGLADAELRDVLLASLRAHDEAGRARLLKRLQPDTAAVLLNVLYPARRAGAPATVAPGKAKLRQDWDALWAEWNDCVLESGLEDGRYIQQEHHWEAPYFCADSLAHDLEAIAKRMKPLFNQVRGEGIAVGFSFLEQLRNLAQELGSGPPEYVDHESTELLLGPEVTSCVLEWEAGGPGAPRGDPFALVDALCKLEAGLDHVFLDAKTVARFVATWPDAAQQAVVVGVERERRRPHWANALARPHSSWFQLVLGLARRCKPDFHTTLSVASIGEDWTLAAPVVSALLKRRDHATAASLLAAAFRSMLRAPAGTEWDPRSVLLARHLHLDHDPRRKAVAERLLRAQRTIAERLRQDDTGAALEVQAIALRDPEDGEAMIATLRAMGAPKLHRVRDELLAEWRELIVGRTLRRSRNPRTSALTDWVPALVNAAVEGPAAEPALHRSVQRALSQAAKDLKRSLWSDSYALHRWGQPPELLPLTRLTLDLDASGRLQRTAPTLHRLLSQSDGEQPSRLDRVRQEWFVRLGGARLLDDVIAFWREQVHSLVPAPGPTEYGLCVEWLVATRELAPEAGDRILAEWAKEHARKRNLWAAVREAGLRIPPGVKGA